MYLRFCFIKVCLFLKKKKKREGKKSTFCSVKERNEVQKYSIFSPLCLHVITYVTPALIAPVVFTVIP